MGGLVRGYRTYRSYKTYRTTALVCSAGMWAAASRITISRGGTVPLRGVAPSRWAAGAVQSATWSKAVVRMGTDKYGENGELTCWSAAIKPYHHKPRKRRYSHPTSRLSGFSAGRQAPKPTGTRGVIAPLSRVLQARSEGSGLGSSTRAASAARLARASENAPDYKTPDDRRPANGHSSGTISHSRTGFASEKRQERTGVRDWSGERRKARPGKARLRREYKNGRPTRIRTSTK